MLRDKKNVTKQRGAQKNFSVTNLWLRRRIKAREKPEKKVNNIKLD